MGFLKKLSRADFMFVLTFLISTGIYGFQSAPIVKKESYFRIDETLNKRADNFKSSTEFVKFVEHYIANRKIFSLKKYLPYSPHKTIPQKAEVSPEYNVESNMISNLSEGIGSDNLEITTALNDILNISYVSIKKDSNDVAEDITKTIDRDRFYTIFSQEITTPKEPDNHGDTTPKYEIEHLGSDTADVNVNLFTPTESNVIYTTIALLNTEETTTAENVYNFEDTTSEDITKTNDRDRFYTTFAQETTTPKEPDNHGDNTSKYEVEYLENNHPDLNVNLLTSTEGNDIYTTIAHLNTEEATTPENFEYTTLNDGTNNMEYTSLPPLRRDIDRNPEENSSEEKNIISNIDVNEFSTSTETYFNITAENNNFDEITRYESEPFDQNQFNKLPVFNNDTVSALDQSSSTNSISDDFENLELKSLPLDKHYASRKTKGIRKKSKQFSYATDVMPSLEDFY